ncbi:unannotated protein [freshwater metagenome]|uniref:Unannotated protein n=1 Tax=freshwater metagenome TaxID=449393 RepID=A0A6J7EWY9_9ZZZZ
MGGRGPLLLARLRMTISSSEAPASSSIIATSSTNSFSAFSTLIFGSIAASLGCMAIHAPDASCTRPDSPWWSGCMWVTSTP